MGRQKTVERKKGTVDSESMKLAVAFVLKNINTIRGASKLYKIPYGTLYSYVKKAKEDGFDNIKFEANYNCRKIFSVDEETLIHNYLLKSSGNHGLSSKDARKLAYAFVLQNNLKHPPSWDAKKTAGIDWYKEFMRRNPDSSICKAEEASSSSSPSFKQHNISQFLLPSSMAFSTRGMELKEVVKVLDGYAPQKLAADWDNVGLLLEPTNHVVSKILLTNDLTLKVFEEAIQSKVDMMVSYHPPIFKALKRLGQGEWKEKVVVGLMENKIALYSPHTAWDCIKGGVNDWLIQPFEGKVEVIQKLPNSQTCRLEVKAEKVNFCKELQNDYNDTNSSKINWLPGQEGMLTTLCTTSEAKKISDVIRSYDIDSAIICQQLVSFPDKSVGYGRLVVLREALSIKEIVNKLKSHLALKHLQLALGHNATEDTQVTRIAVCAGSGTSLLRDVHAEVYITGEMGHHEVLDCTNNSKGCPASVLLCNHSNSERGFLGAVMKGYLEEKLSGRVEVLVSKADRDPLQTV